jgi:alpha-methylacyl-CoA racemase
LLERSDACFAPVLTTDEAAAHPHNRTRGTYVEIGGVVQPAPAPRFSRTRPELPTPPHENLTGEAAAAALEGWLDAAEIAEFKAAGAFG